MKRIIVLIVAIICTISLFGQKKSIVGNKVKTMVVYGQKIEKGKTINVKESESKYNADGYLIEEIEYKDCKLDKRTTYEYDENKNRIKETEYSSSGDVNKIIEYKYKGDLKVEKYVYKADGKLKSKKIYQYENY